MSTQFTNRQWRLPNNENKDKQSNYSMDFDGSSLIDLGDITMLNGVSQASYSFWFKLSSYTPVSGSASVMLVGSNAKGASCYIYNNNFYIHNFNTQYILASSGVPSLNEWHHVCCVFDSGVAVAYLDGVSVGTVTEPTLTTTASDFGDNYNIGYSSFYSAYMNANGQIDGLSFFNYALTDGTGGTVNQIATLYGSSSTGIGNPMSLSPKPVAYYPLGDQDAFNGASYLTPNASLKDFVFDFGTYTDNKYISINNTFDSIITGTNFTISSWINLDSVTSSQLKFIFTNDTLQLTITDKITTYLKGASGYFLSPFNSNTTLTTGEWYNVVLIKSGSDYTYYLNGSPDGTVNNSTSVVNSIETTSIIGMYYNPSTYGFNGLLSNTQIFNTALPATGSNSIETLYNNGSPLTSMSGFTSLQGWWKLDASATYDSSTTTWTIEDSSSNSNDGTSSGMTQANLVASDLSFKTSYSPYALNFDSASGYYISIPNSTDFNLGTSFTISGWFNVTSYVSNMGYISFDSSTRGWFLFHQNTNLALYDGTSVATLNSNLQPTNEWNSYIITYDGTDLIFYLNGQQNSTQSVSINLQTNGNDGQIGNQQFAAGRFYNGSISNISIWNTALTSAQVTEIYSEGIPQNLNNHSAVSSLVSWWQLGSNSSYTNKWICLDEKGTNNGESVNMTEASIVDGVGSSANGLSSGMGGDEVIGSAPFSDANSLSVNMDVLDRTEDTPA